VTIKSIVWVMIIFGCSAGVSAQDKSSVTEDALFTELLATERQFHYQENPGTGPQGVQVPTASTMAHVLPEDQKRRTVRAEALLRELSSINKMALTKDNQLNFEMLRYKLESSLVFLKHKAWRIPLYSDSGFHTSPTRMWHSINFARKKDYEAYIERLKDLPRYLAEHTANLRQGIDENFTLPKVVLDGLLPTFSAVLTDNVEENSFYQPFRKMNDMLGDDDVRELRKNARDAIKNHVLPAYQKLATFMQDEYYPAAGTEIGASELTGGADYYAAMVRYYTTLDVTADEVHALGLKEVARIRSEMEAIIKTTEFDGSFNDFLVYLRTAPQFYAKTERELLSFASYLAKVIDGRVPKLFNKLPRQPYGVEAVPSAIAPNYTTGRYISAPLGSPRGGYYWVNTYDLKSRPLYTLPALTLHEAVPGHHLQTALAAELENVPQFRLEQYPHAFGEGWGLYAEKLGLDLDLYETPYEQFGRLTYEMWRACRLVIDTGIHAKGWSRAQAITLLEENSALAKHNIQTEVDRYIAWPGQALAYKIGELKFLELRVLAETELGEFFDIRDFHDRVLSAGGIPLYLLESRVKSWIAETKAQNLTPESAINARSTSANKF